MIAGSAHLFIIILSIFYYNIFGHAWKNSDRVTRCVNHHSLLAQCTPEIPPIVRLFFAHWHGRHFFAWQSCSRLIYPYLFNINYYIYLHVNIIINYFQGGLSISILYQLFKKFPFQFQYILSISPHNVVKINNSISISHCYQYQCWYQLSK